MKPYCIAIDWGTSTFRIWVLANDGTSLKVRRTDEGLQHALTAGFKNILEQNLGELGVDDDLPVIICGMAGSRQGWCEARYIDTPINFGQIVENSVAVPDANHDIRILPGIAQRDPLEPDVIRGEETQLLGLFSQLPQNGLVCMPGTHSKWVRFNRGQLEHFSTFMTGELFGLLANHSILNPGIAGSRRTDPNSEEFLAAFTDSVNNPQEITNRLFKIRSSHLLGYSSLNSSAARLSGSVIGLELAGVLSKYESIGEVTLVANSQFAELYTRAFKSRGIVVHNFDSDDAVRSGLFKAATALWSNSHERKKREA